jgi:hypothetical protein
MEFKDGIMPCVCVCVAAGREFKGVFEGIVARKGLL